MLVKLEKYIFAHLPKWGLKAKKLTPIFRFNKEANGLVESGQIGMVVFWFADEEKKPLLVTKFQSHPTHELYLKALPIYPKIYEVTSSVIFMEPLEGPTYEMDLSLALFGPEGSREAVSEAVTRQLSEMGDMYLELSHIDLEPQQVDCGEWAKWKGATLEIQKALSQLPYTNHHVIIDHNPANIFPGPCFVDQFDLRETYQKRKEGEPGILDPIRFLIAYLRTSPLNRLYKDWVQMLGCALNDKRHSLIISKPLQDFFSQIGLEKREIWALFVMGMKARIEDELKFHEKNVYFSQLKNELEALLNQLIKARTLFLKGDQSLLNQIKKNEEAFLFPATKRVHDPSGNPRLLRKDYKNYNIVSLGERLFAVKRSLGSIDLVAIAPSRLRRLVQSKKILVSDSLESLLKSIDRNLFNTGMYLLKTALRKLDKYCLFRYTRPNDRTL